MRTTVLVTVYGISVLTLMMVFYALESRHCHYVLAFGICCVLSSIYGFITGVWPFGVVEFVWSIVAFRRWNKLGNQKCAQAK